MRVARKFCRVQSTSRSRAVDNMGCSHSSVPLTEMSNGGKSTLTPRTTAAASQDEQLLVSSSIRKVHAFQTNLGVVAVGKIANVTNW